MVKITNCEIQNEWLQFLTSHSKVDHHLLYLGITIGIIKGWWINLKLNWNGILNSELNEGLEVIHTEFDKKYVIFKLKWNYRNKWLNFNFQASRVHLINQVRGVKNFWSLEIFFAAKLFGWFTLKLVQKKKWQKLYFIWKLIRRCNWNISK